MSKTNNIFKFKLFHKQIFILMLLTICTGGLCFGCINAAKQDNPKGTGKDDDSVLSGDSIMTIAIFSDVHIGKKNTRPEEKFNHALKQLSVLAPKLDAIAFAGDITDQGKDDEYLEFMKILNANTLKSVKKIFCMGNHEYFRDGVVRYGGESKAFLEECQKAYKKNIFKELDTDTVINGVHVISVSARSSAANYAACEKFLISKVESAAKENPDMPIVIIAHEGAGSYFEGGCSGYTQKTVNMLEKYPQIIFFSGHKHFALQDMRMIQQYAYTRVQTSTLGADFWNYSFEAIHQPENADTASQGLLMTVMKDGTTEIVRYDFTNNQTIGETWKVNPKSFVYDNVQRKKLATEPVFEAGAILEITDPTKKSVVLKFPKAIVNDEVSDGIVYSYRIRIIDKETEKIIFNDSMMSDYYMGLAAKDKHTFTVPGLKPGVEYVASVIAVSVYDRRSNPIEVDFTIPE